MENLEKRFYAIDSFLLFVVGSFFFWEFIYELSNMLGSISCGSPDQALTELIRVFPIIFAAFVTIYLAYCLHCAYQAKDKVTRAKVWRVNGQITIVLGIIEATYVILGDVLGIYEKLIEGYPTMLFPLDIFVYGVLIILYGVYSIIYSKIIVENDPEAPFINITLKNGKKRKSLGFLTGLVYLFALAGFQACIRGFYILDFTHGAIFFNIMLWLMYFVPVEMFLVYRYVYIELPVSMRVGKLKPIALTFLCINIVILGLYMLSVEIYNEAPNQNAFGILPLDFTASLNAFLLLYGSVAVITPIVALIESFRNKKEHFICR